MTAISDAPRAPYSLEPTTFPCPALASLAGRAPLGGSREIVLGCFLAARIASDATASAGGLTAEQRATRAREAVAWLSTTAIPSNVRVALGRLIEATAGDAAAARAAIAAAVDSVITVTAGQLDPAARLELARLAQAVER